MASRLNLHEEFCNLLESQNVYFNPPESVKLRYPCIKYSMDGIDTRYANDKSYKNVKRYAITLIDSNPDSAYCDKILATFPMCKFDRSYVFDNLCHFVYTIYY